MPTPLFSNREPLGAVRVAVVVPYWTFWESSSGIDLRRDREAMARRTLSGLDKAEIVAFEVADSPAAAAAIAAALSATPFDVLIIVVTMAVPPTHSMPVIEAFPNVPLIVCPVMSSAALGPAVSHADITREGATVGTPMLTNVLSRSERPFHLVPTRSADTAGASLEDAIVGAGGAARLSRARIGRVGLPLAGFDCVEVDEEALASEIGMQFVHIAPAEFLGRYRDVPAQRVDEGCEQVVGEYLLDPEVPREAIVRAVRADLAIRDIVSDHQLDAGAFNCHVPEIRLGAEVGIAPCFALGRSTSAGVPWTCTGDVLTAIAMLTMKLLAGVSLYHELEMLDSDSGMFLIANSGEHDEALNTSGRVEVGLNPWFGGGQCGSLCARMPTPSGTATLLAFASGGRRGHRFVVGRGHFADMAFPQTGTTNGGFIFSAGPAAEAWVQWCEAGVNHHSTACPGDITSRVEAMSRHLRVGLEVV